MPTRTPNVTTETDYAGAAIPEYWQAFRDLSDTAIMAQGTLRGGSIVDGAWSPNPFTVEYGAAAPSVRAIAANGAIGNP